MLAAENESERTLIDELLEQQRDLTAVRRFSRWHHDMSGEPALAGHYRDLIPLTQPRPGEQYAFDVDLDKCSGCKACVSACHSLNGLDDGELWRSVGLVTGGTGGGPGSGVPLLPNLPKRAPETPFRFSFSSAQQSCSVNALADASVVPRGTGPAMLQHVTTACHHCAEPGCADGCPVLAYEKDPVTGIVRHLDDQCIGCQYCVLKCPYEVPKYSKARGIVRKCDMCHGRLSDGEAPACVQACPHEAIRITTVRRDRSPVEDWKWMADAPDPGITRPTTRYISSRAPVGMARAVDAEAPRLEPAHWPLVFMLVLTQLAGGLHLLHAVLFNSGWQDPLRILAGSAFGILLIGLAVSVTHLGRPLKAWRAFLGWRRSWMSREIIAFSIYAGCAGLLLVDPMNGLLARGTAVVAIGGIVCSALIYVDTRRPAWNVNAVFGKFFGTTFLLGATGGAAWAGWFAPVLAPPLAAVATVIRTVLFAWEGLQLLRFAGRTGSPGHRAAVTILALLRPALYARISLFCASTLFSIMAIFNVSGAGAVWGSIACGTTLMSQVLERYMFFAASAPPRMPGGIAANGQT